MKKFIAIGAMALVMTTCSTSAVGAMNQASAVAQVSETKVVTEVKLEAPKVSAPVRVVGVVAGPTLRSEAPAVGSFDWMAEQKAKQDALEAEIVHLERVAKNTKQLNIVISQLEGRVGKTWYVFSGATPQGWDCSGLTMWAYEQLGFNLEHRASKQQHAGEKVSEPKVGDIVAFVYNGNKSAYHVGIWVGPDEMIHAGGGKGDRTSIVSISKFAGDHSEVSFRRILETN